MGWSVTINNKTGESLDLMLWHFDRGGWRELWYFEKGGRQTGGQVPSANIAADDSVTFSWDVAPPEGISGRIVYAGESDSVDVSWTVSAPIAPSTDLSGSERGEARRFGRAQRDRVRTCDDAWCRGRETSVVVVRGGTSYDSTSRSDRLDLPVICTSRPLCTSLSAMAEAAAEL
jgi:hypothetical protein